MSLPEIQTFTQRTVEETVTEKIVVGDKVEVCRITVNREGPKGGRKTTEVTEVVCHTRKNVGDHYGSFYVVEPDLLQILATEGWFPDNDHYNKIVRETPFTHIMSGKPYEVVRLSTWDNTLYTVDDKPLPVAMNFDYSNGRVNNQVFDLDKLIAHLKSRGDVTFHEPDRTNPNPLLHHVPSYNRGGGSGTLHLSFTWHPDVRTFRRYVKEAATPGYYDRYSAAHKIMGTDKFRLPERDYSEEEEDYC